MGQSMRPSRERGSSEAYHEELTMRLTGTYSPAFTLFYNVILLLLLCCSLLRSQDFGCEAVNNLSREEKAASNLPVQILAE